MQVNLRWTISHSGRVNFLHLLSPMETCLSWLGKGFNFNFFVGRHNQGTGNNASPVDQERNGGGSIEFQTRNGGAGSVPLMQNGEAGSEPLMQNGGVGSQLLMQNGEQGDTEV